MARRRKPHPLKGAIDLVALLPWWVCLVLALVSYVGLHAIAISTPPTYKPGSMGGVMVGNVARGLAVGGQYLVPGVLVFGALGSFLRRRRRQALIDNASQSKSADALNDMSWAEFELLVGEAFRLQGYSVVEMGGAGSDGGIDLVLKKGSEKFLVQCKQWKAFKVSVTVVRELYGVMAARGAAGGFVVTSGRFTEDAVAFANGRNIKLIDGPMLHKLIGLVSLGTSHGAASSSSSGEAEKSQATEAPNAKPSCPSCGAMMTKRLAKRGPNTGSEFWGCSTYPACKGTRTL